MICLNGVIPMPISRRKAIFFSGSTLAGLSLASFKPAETQAQATAPAPAAAQEPWPDSLVERTVRAGFPVPLPLNPDGTAPEHQASEAGPIAGTPFWRTPGRVTPQIEYDYKKMAIKIDTRGLGKLG